MGDAVAASFAKKFATAFGNLSSMELVFAKAFGPERNQGEWAEPVTGLSGTPARGAKKREMNRILPGRGHDDAQGIQGVEMGEIRNEGSDLEFGIENRKVIARFKNFASNHARPFTSALREPRKPQVFGRKIEFDEIVPSGGEQQAAPRFEPIVGWAYPNWLKSRNAGTELRAHEIDFQATG